MPKHDADHVEHCRTLAEERFGLTEADLADLTAPPVSLADLLAELRFGADDVRHLARRVERSLADLRIDLHAALRTSGPRLDLKLPPDVRRSLERLDEAVAELRDCGNEMLRDATTALDFEKAIHPPETN